MCKIFVECNTSDYRVQPVDSRPECVDHLTELDVVLVISERGYS
jgi:hypothetical protein